MTEVFRSRDLRHVSQATHFRFWVAALPYHSHSGFFSPGRPRHTFSPIPISFRRRIGSAPSKECFTRLISRALLKRNFAIVSICGHGGGSPPRKPLPSSACSPASSPSISAHVLPSHGRGLLLVQNALLWIALHLPAKSAAIEGILSSLRPNRLPDYPLLALEHKLIQYLTKRRRGERNEAKDSSSS